MTNKVALDEDLLSITPADPPAIPDTESGRHNGSGPGGGNEITARRSSDLIARAADGLNSALGRLQFLLTGIPETTERHYGPGSHPGTGTPQEVHAGDDGEWSISPGNYARDLSDGGRIVRIDSKNDDGTVDVTVVSGFDRWSRYKNIDPEELVEPNEDEIELWTGEGPKAMLDRAVELFGLTENPFTAGFILPRGKLLDLSGRTMGAGDTGQRMLDHRELGIVLGENDPGGTEGMIEFMARTGAIRMSFDTDGVLSLDFAAAPGTEERQRVANLVRQANDLVWDITDYDAETHDWELVASGEGLATPRNRDEMLSDAEKLKPVDEAVTWRPKSIIFRHFGPGPHPGTGTPQEAHAGNGRKPSFAEEFWTNDEVNRRIKKWELAQDPDVGKAEMGILVTSSGVEIEFVGSKHRIDFTEETIQGARNDDADYKVFSHTHPSDMPFSPEDFMVSVLMKLNKIRVVSPEWIYEMRINPDMTDITASNIYGGMKDRVANMAVKTDEERVAMMESGVHPDHAMSQTMSNHVHNSWHEFAGLFSGAILDYRRIANRR